MFVWVLYLLVPLFGLVVALMCFALVYYRFALVEKQHQNTNAHAHK